MGDVQYSLSRDAWEILDAADRGLLEDPSGSNRPADRVRWTVLATAVFSESLDEGSFRDVALLRAGNYLAKEAGIAIVVDDAEAPRCRVCGCIDAMACDEGCYWVEEDLCSACTPEGGEVAGG